MDKGLGFRNPIFRYHTNSKKGTGGGFRDLGFRDLGFSVRGLGNYFLIQTVATVPGNASFSRTGRLEK